MLMEVPMVDPKELVSGWRKKSDDTVVDSTWTWWNRFRTYADFDSKISLSLEVSADIPSEEELKRWLGEPVSQLIIPSHIFIRNPSNYPVLSKGHQHVIIAFLRHNVNFLIKANAKDGSLRNYVDYIRHLCTVHYKKDPMQGYILSKSNSFY